MIVYIIIIVVLLIIIVLLSMSIFYLTKKTIYLSNDEKEYIKFVIEIFNEYGDDLGIQTKEQHKLLVEKLNKIINKHLI